MNKHTMDHGEGMDHMDHEGKGHADQPPQSPPPTFGVHNQMMVGEQTIYLSHLPMFMFNPQRHEHNFQVILEVTLNGPGNPQAVYANDRKKNPKVRMYTMSPDPFEMVELDPHHPKRHALTGTIFRGHLERDGEQIIDRATAQVMNTVYFHEFDPNAEPLAQLDYLLFGKAPELFLAHVITRPPDFDQILAVGLAGQSPSALTADDLSRGIRVSVPGRANAPHTRIKAGERVTGQTQLDGAQATLTLEFEAGTEFYFEEGELSLPMTMRQTPEERAAGF
ncbi:MAG: hypothetical protein M1546_23410 [Chloroflexi bacterium]|nr:hypothetical protein [Chloroflexota bacterium]